MIGSVRDSGSRSSRPETESPGAAGAAGSGPGLLGFVTLAYAITWIAVAPLVLAELGVLHVSVSRLLHGLGAAGPIVAAYLVRRAKQPAFTVRDLFRRDRASPMPWAWRAACIALPIALALAGLLVLRVVRGGWPSFQGLAAAVASPLWLADLVVGSLLYGLGEEPGWRGHLLPELQRRRGPIQATLVLTAIWAAWHAPFFVYRYEFAGLGTVVGFLVALTAGAFWLTFLYNSTGGSVWTVVLWHIVWNVVNIGTAAISDTWVAVVNVLMIAVGIAVLVIWGRRELSLSGEAVRR